MLSLLSVCDCVRRVVSTPAKQRPGSICVGFGGLPEFEISILVLNLDKNGFAREERWRGRGSRILEG